MITIIYIFLMILLIGILLYMTPLVLFSFFNKEAMEEYHRIHKENRINGAENIDQSKLLYTKLVYSGMSVDDKIHIKYSVVHPYDIFLKDREKYGSKISSWSRESPSYRSYENESPPLMYGGISNPNDKKENTDDIGSAPIPVDTTIWFGS